jgi:Ni,Fe-hydrogenase III small subunit/formate hydrogenlyase subunit 6/NADH:ubiquinone oxidoreductase subunit I
MLKAILRSLRTGVVTIGYPEEPARVPERFRGAPQSRPGAPFDDLPPPAVCPSGAISVEGSPADPPTPALSSASPRGGGSPRHAIDLGRCVFCGRCAEVGGDAVELGRELELASRGRERLVVAVERGPGGRTVAVAPPPAGPEVAELVRRTLGRSLHLRHLDAGSCNACDWELSALLNPVYDVRRLGIDFVASPRHADGVVVTGPVTRNLDAAVRRTWEAVPEPRIAIAVGACATSGGIAGRSYASAGGAAEVLPVDVFVPGCPPRPEAIIFGILLAVGRAEERRRGAGAR